VRDRSASAAERANTFAACGEFNPVLTDDIGQRASDESRARERAERDAKIAAHPELFC